MFELSFLLFVMAGELKTVAIFQPISRVIDLTVLFGLISLAAGAMRFVRGGSRITVEAIRYLGVYALFLGYVLLSTVLGGSLTGAAVAKAALIASLVTWCVIAACVLMPLVGDRRRFAELLIGFSLLLSAFAIYSAITNPSSVVTKLGGLGEGYQRLGRVGAIATVVLLLEHQRPAADAWRYASCSLWLPSVE